MSLSADKTFNTFVSATGCLMKLNRKFPFLKREESEIQSSDSGRRYGWLVEKGGEVVANLEYVRGDEQLQFWHVYQLSIGRRDMACLASDSNAWLEHKITLRNARHMDVVISDFMVLGAGNGFISVRGACVPEDKFK
jgi:hypothetical protein